MIISFINTSYPLQAQTERSYCLIGHRGAAAVAPENTLVSIRKALDVPVDRIEIDVHLTKDGELVLMHDRKLNRTTNGKGEVRNHTLDEIKTFDAGSRFSDKFLNECVPTLDEVIRLINGRCELLVEVKEDSRYTPGIEQKVIDVIRRNNAIKWCFVISFKHRVLEYCHKHAPEIRLGRLYVGKLPLIPVYITEGVSFRGPKKYPYAEEFNLNKSFASRCMIRKVHKMGKKINAWTDDNPKHVSKLLKRGINGFMTNDPARLAREIKGF